MLRTKKICTESDTFYKKYDKIFCFVKKSMIMLFDKQLFFLDLSQAKKSSHSGSV